MGFRNNGSTRFSERPNRPIIALSPIVETVWSYGVWVLSFGVGCDDVVILLFVLKMIAYGENFFSIIFLDMFQIALLISYKREIH